MLKYINKLFAILLTKKQKNNEMDLNVSQQR